jgi:hypothetical protein
VTFFHGRYSALYLSTLRTFNLHECILFFVCCFVQLCLNKGFWFTFSQIRRYRNLWHAAEMKILKTPQPMQTQPYTLPNWQDSFFNDFYMSQPMQMQNLSITNNSFRTNLLVVINKINFKLTKFKTYFINLHCILILLFSCTCTINGTQLQSLPSLLQRLSENDQNKATHKE